MTDIIINRADIALTKNQELVMSELSNSDRPLSAYTILDNLRIHGFRAPLQVYRALDSLLEFGLVHRLESLNAFMACRNPTCASHITVAFMICEQCDDVSEFSDKALATKLNSIAKEASFKPKKSTIEFKGVCLNCQVK